MPDEIYRSCTNCGTINLNRDYCENCGEIVNNVLKRNLERERQEKKRQALRKSEKKNGITLFFEKAVNSQNFLVRAVAKFFYSIWVIVIAIGSFLAFLLGYIAA